MDNPAFTAIHFIKPRNRFLTTEHIVCRVVHYFRRYTVKTSTYSSYLVMNFTKYGNYRVVLDVFHRNMAKL